MEEFKTPSKKSDPALDDTITIPPSPLLHRLGYGTGVSVMKLLRSPRAGQMRSPWALKMINKRVKHKNIYSDRLKAEAELLKRMCHKNIVGYRSFGKSKVLGMEACDLSLGNLIENRVEIDCTPFAPAQILKVCVDIASALNYLHTEMLILHGDVKSYNILVNGDFLICKLCDFGVTIPLNKDGTVDKEKAGDEHVYYGTEAWSAPEVIYDDEITDKTDIWALGLTMWEMMALVPPHTQTEEDTTLDESVSMDESIESAIDTISQRYGTRPAVPACISAERYSGVLALFGACTQRDAAARPAAAALARAVVS